MSSSVSKTPPSDRRTDAFINRENAAWKNLKAIIDALKSQMIKVRAEGVRENVDKAVSHIISLGAAREALHDELRAMAKPTNGAPDSGVTTDRVDALEAKVLGVLDQVQRRLENQDKVLATLINPPALPLAHEVKRPDQDGPSAAALRAEPSKRVKPLPERTVSGEKGPFVTVQKRKRRPARTTLSIGNELRARPAKTPAVLVKVLEGTSCAETVRNVKSVVNPADLGFPSKP